MVLTNAWNGSTQAILRVISIKPYKPYLRLTPPGPPFDNWVPLLEIAKLLDAA